MILKVQNGPAKVRAVAGDEKLVSLCQAKQKGCEKVQRGYGSDPALMKGLKEATAVLKDLAAVAKTLNDQGADAEARACGVVLLPAVEDV